MKALIIVDIQRDFLPSGPLGVSGGDEIIPIVNRLMDHYPLVVATRDWHPPDHGSFAENHPGKQPYEMGELAGLPQVMWPTHCVEETEGAEFADALEVQKIDKIFSKGTRPEIDSYSGFHDNGRLHSTGLADWLRGEDVTEVAICGLATDYCVKFTALDAVSEGFEATLLAEACRGVDLNEGDIATAIAEMDSQGVRIA